MGVYVNVITRRARTISGRKVHTYKFAYKCGGSMFDEYPKGRTRDEHMSFKYVRPVEKKWAESGDNIKEALFVDDYVDGAEVYRAFGVSFYDTGDGGEHVGRLLQDGSGKFRIEFLKERHWKVTFKGRSNMKPDSNRDVTVVVKAINEFRAKREAAKAVEADESICWMDYTTMYPKIEKYDPPMTEDEALNLAMRALEKSRHYPLSDRVEARRLIEKMRKVRPIDSNLAFPNGGTLSRRHLS